MIQFVKKESFGNYICAFFGFCKHRQKHNRQLLCVIGLLTLFVGGMPLIAFPQNLSSANNLTVRGQVRLPSDRAMPDEGLDVVLLKFVLSPEGQVTPTGPQGRDKTDTGGNFEFVKVSPDLRAGYQIGTRVEGELYSSKVFFMQAGEKLIKIDIIVPSISADVEKLETSQVSLVIESGLGAITVTEMLVINNSSPDRIDTRINSLEQVLPKGVENFRMIETKSGATIQHQLEANLLEIEHVFPTGSTQIIYQYRLSAWFGSLEMNREFSHSLEKVSVFTPDGLLRIKSDQLTFSGQQSLHDTAFLSWKSKASDTNRLSFKISNIPVHSLQYTGIPVVILFLLFAAVALFFRTRLLNNIHSEKSTPRETTIVLELHA